MATQTFDQLITVGFNEWTTLNPNFTPNIEGTDSYFKIYSVSAIATCIVQDTVIVQNNIFPGSSTSVFEDKHASNLGMPPRQGSLPSTGTVYLYSNSYTSFVPDGNYNISSGTEMTSDTSSVIFETTSLITFEDGVQYGFNGINNTILGLPIQSLITGTNSFTAASTTLTFSEALTIPVSALYINYTNSPITVDNVDASTITAIQLNFLASNSIASVLAELVSASSVTGSITNTTTAQSGTFVSIAATSGTYAYQIIINSSSSSWSSGNSLTFNLVSNVGATTLTISQCEIPSTGLASGSNIESDQQFSVRINDFMQNPRGGGNSGDYIKWCFRADSNTTEATVLIGSYNIYSILYVISLTGNANDNYYIDGDSNNGYIQSVNNRTMSLTDLIIVQDYLNINTPVNSSPNVISAATYFIINDNSGNDNINLNTNQTLTLTVSLSQGLTLDSIIVLTNSDGSTQEITVENLILRELRRGIVNTPLKGDALYNDETLISYVIPIDSLQSTILIGLSDTINLQGNYAAILKSVNIKYTNNANPDGIDYISLPDSQINGVIVTNGQAYIVYDINLDSTAISVVTYDG